MGRKVYQEQLRKLNSELIQMGRSVRESHVAGYESVERKG